MAPSAPNAIDLSFLRSRAAQKRIAAITLAVTLVGGAYAFLAPKWFRAVVTLVPAKTQRGGGLASLLGGDAAGLAAGLLENSVAGADGPRIAAVLESTSVSDAVIARFDLKARYNESYQENARDELWKHCNVKFLTKPQLVQLSCEDQDPRFVQEMVSYFAEYGNQVFQRVSVSSASEEARFLEKRVADLRKLAEESAMRMRDFQEKHRIIDLDTQAKAVVGAMAALNTQRIGKELELDYARAFAARDEPSLRQLRTQLSALGDRLRELEAPPTTDTAAAGGKRDAGLFPAALQVPKLRAEYEQLYRDRKVAEATLIFSLERLEGAKANEARDVSTFLVLDPPALPTKKSRPKRAIIIVAAILAGLIVSVLESASRAGALQPILRSMAIRARPSP